MNYLAHMYLSCSDEDLIIGNMLVDMMSIKRLRELPVRYHKGFELHGIKGPGIQRKSKEGSIQILKAQQYKDAGMV